MEFAEHATAATKIVRVVGALLDAEVERDEIERVVRRILDSHVDDCRGSQVLGPVVFPPDTDVSTKCSYAMAGGHTVHFSYRPVSGVPGGRREAVLLADEGRGTYLAYDLIKKAPRRFRWDRMDDIVVFQSQPRVQRPTGDTVAEQE